MIEMTEMTESHQHPNMTDKWFAAAIERAKEAGLTISLHPAARRLCYVSSRGEPSMKHTVSRHSCTCAGHLNHGRCYHRAYAIYANDRFNVLDAARDGVRIAVAA